MSGRDWMLVLTLERGVLTSSNMSSHARVCQRSVPLNIPAIQLACFCGSAQESCPQSWSQSKFHIGHPWHSTCLDLVRKWVSADKIYSPPLFRSAFIHTFIPQMCIENPCMRCGGRETDHNAGLAIKAAKVYKQIITVIRRVCDNRGRYRNVWIQEK